MCTWKRVTGATALVLLMGCASSSGRSDENRAVIFSEGSVPVCAFEVLDDVSTVVSVRGREEAERRLHSLLGRAAERRGGDGVMAVVIKAPDRLPFVVVQDGRRRPTAEDLPAAEWSATGQAIRFTDPSCRR
jgi:hypothetical protein